uniref:Uncharacterized protein n=1 Tax=Panagrolaimus sp. ES5 TaxID=591445 RepID=A0AC34FAB5_9BILA
MRLYCLSSIEKVAPTPIITKPYDITAAENLSTGIDEFQTRLKITTALDYYCLTEICIRYKYIENTEIHRKVYVMNIYRHDSGLLTFRMIV